MSPEVGLSPRDEMGNAAMRCAIQCVNCRTADDLGDVGPVPGSPLRQLFSRRSAIAVRRGVHGIAVPAGVCSFRRRLGLP